MYKCPWCDYSHKNLNHSLRIHCMKLHKRSSRELCDALFYDFGQSRPKCKCGCGEECKFLDLGRRYREWRRGHISRVENNWGHNPTALKNSQKRRNEMFANGELEPWNKDETEETHPSVKKNADAFRAWYAEHQEEESQVRSDRMKKGRLDGTIPTLYGEEHSQWKGGISSLQGICRSYLTPWIEMKMGASNYRCEHCSSHKFLCVHHTTERFADIARVFAKKHGWIGDISDLTKKKIIAEEVRDYHISNNVDGLVLCNECHAKEHERLNEPLAADRIRNFHNMQMKAKSDKSS